MSGNSTHTKSSTASITSEASNLTLVMADRVAGAVDSSEFLEPPRDAKDDNEVPVSYEIALRSLMGIADTGL